MNIVKEDDGTKINIHTMPTVQTYIPGLLRAHYNHNLNAENLPKVQVDYVKLKLG